MLIYDGRNDKTVPKTDRSIEVISANKLSSGDHMTLRLKGRDDFSLFFVEKGKMTFDNVVLNKNQLWIYPPQVPQEYFSYKKDEVTYYYIHFTGNNIMELFSSLRIPTLTALDFIFDKEIFEKIRKAAACDDALSKLKSEYLTLELLSYLAKIKPARARENMMAKVIDEMHHTYFLPYDVNRFASLLSLSPGRFNHLFKEITHLSPQRYFNNIKMENAAALLLNTTLPIYEIAKKTGFSDPFYFGQAFKKHFGISPKEYKNRLCFDGLCDKIKT